MAEFDVFNPLSGIKLRITDEQVTEITEWFAINSKPLLSINDDSINVITIENLKEFLELKKYHRRNFHYPSYAEIMKEAEKLKAGVTRVLTKEQMIYMLNKWVIDADIKHELVLAFKVFDTENRSFLDIDDLKVIVTAYADAFNKDEVREMLRDANVRGDGNVFYEEFVESLLSVAPDLYKLKADYLYINPDEEPSIPPEVKLEDSSKSAHNPQPITTQPQPTAVAETNTVKKQKKK